MTFYGVDDSSHHYPVYFGGSANYKSFFMKPAFVVDISPGAPNESTAKPALYLSEYNTNFNAWHGDHTVVFKTQQTQTADRVQWQDKDNNIVTVLNKDGWLGIGEDNPSTPLHINGDATFNGKLHIATGSNKSVNTVTLTAGTVTVSNTSVKTGSKIIISRNTPSGTIGELSAPSSSIVDGTSFVINSANAGDNSTVNYWIIN